MPFASVNGTDLYYERYGDGHPIIFCHGDGRDHRAWMPQVEALSDDFELITYDLNGYGRSCGSSREEQSYKTHAADLRALTEELELTDPTVVGWSMGGRVAYSLAARDPERIASLVLLEPASRNFDEPPLYIKPLLYTFPTLGRLIGWPRLLTIRRWMLRLRGDDDPRREDPVRGLDISKSEYYADVESQIDSREYSKMMVSMRREMLNEDTPAIDFSAITVPVLALTGEDPRESYEETLATLADEVETVQRETIPDAGHDAQIANPDEFNRLLCEFLAEHTAAADSNATTVGD